MMFADDIVLVGENLEEVNKGPFSPDRKTKKKICTD